MKLEKKVPGNECGQLLGVSRKFVGSVKVMLGQAGCRKVFPSHISKFLQRYPTFSPADAASPAAIAGFAARHPGFEMPQESGRQD